MADAPIVPKIQVSGGGALGSVLGAGSAIAIASYLIAVVYQGNLDTLGADLATEEGYLEFVIAIVIIWAIHEVLPANGLTDLITGMAVIAVLLKFAANANFGTALSNFASGKANMLQTVQALAGQATT